MATLLYVRTSSGGSGPDVFLQDLGIVVATGAGWTLLSSSAPDRADGSGGQFTAREIRDSAELFTAINSGSLEWSKDGAAVETASSYTSDYMLFQDFTDDSPYFPNVTVSGTLTASGFDITSHFNGGPGKHDASEIDVEGTYSNIPGSPGNLESVISGINTGLAGVAAYSFANIQADVGTAVADAAADTLSIVGADGILTGATPGTDTITISGTNLLPRDGTRPMTGDLDMGGNDVTNVGLVDGRDVSIDGAALDAHLNGGANKHDASEIDVEGTYSNIPGTPGDLETTISGINISLGTIVTDHGGLTGLLDDDHPQYALLNGNAARNTVSGVFDFTNGDLILPVDVSAPAGVDGKVTTVGGIQYVYDGSRSKWLSVNRETFWTSRNSGSASNIYLRGADGIATSATGFRMVRDGTITGLVAAFSTAGTATIQVRRNDSVTVLASLAVAAATGAQNGAVNVDFSAGDEIQIFLSGSAQYPTAGVEVAWRI